MIIFHHKGAWSMLIFTAFSVVFRHIHTFIFLLFVVIMAFEHFWKVVCTVETRFRKTLIFFSLSVLALAVFFFSHHLFCTTRATEGQPSFFFAEFVSSCLPVWAKAHHQASLSASTTIHHQAGVREGAGVGGGARGGEVRQGASNGAESAPHPSFSSPQAAENTGLCHRQQPHSSLTTSTMGLQIYSGEARPAPFFCSLAPSPLSLAPPIQLFYFLLVTLFPWLFSLTLYPSALVPLLSPLGRHSSYFVPLVLAQSGLSW